MPGNMRNRPPVLSPLFLAGALALTLFVGGVRPAAARDLVKETAALVLAEEPPPTRSQVLEKQRRDEALQAKQEKKPVADDTPVYKRWWFWALTAAVVGGTVALGVWAIEPTRTPAKNCAPGVIACFGDGRRN